MNTSIHTQAEKTAEAAASRQETMGVFIPGQHSRLNTPSFDSFISKENPDQRHSKEIEEEEKEKKRKKAEQSAAALAAAHTPSTPPATQDKLSLETSHKPPQQPANDSELKNPARTDSTKTSRNQENPAPPAKDSKEEAVSGTKSAADSDDMISLAAMDELDAHLPANSAKEASITTSGRLATLTPADRLAATTFANSARPNPGTTPTGPSPLSGAESLSNQSGAGTPSLPQLPRTTANQKTAESSATSMLRSLRVEIEKFTQTNRSQLQIELPVNDTESVKVRLSMRGNELHTVFVTESAELREALQKAWPEFSQNSRDRGFRFGDPAFQQSANQQGAPSGDREARKRASAPNTTVSAAQSTKPKSTPATVATPTRPGSVSLWA